MKRIVVIGIILGALWLTLGRTKPHKIVSAPPREIETFSANMHLIPADAAVARALGNIRKGQTVSVSGYWVEVRGGDGWGWRSSLTREDTGQGACELIFVQDVTIR